MNTRLKAFSESEQGIRIRKELVSMARSKEYNTSTSYSTFDPKGLGFVEKQMKYMSQYPNMNHAQYVSNLKIMTKRSK
jgi:hypothetical protein